MKKMIIWLLANLWLAVFLAVNACSNDSGENISPSSNSEAQTSSSSSETPTPSSSSGIQTFSSSSETQAPSSSSEVQTSSSSSKIAISSSSEATSGTFVDTRDYGEYKWVKIGEQIWMAQNLNYSRDVNITLGRGEAPCYDENMEKCSIYGRLYGITTKIACPVGWHLPTKAEWQTLVDFIGEDAGKKLKATSGWNSGNGTDEYGFAALPGGLINPALGFQDIGTDGYWWSSNEEDDERGYIWTIGSGNTVSLYLLGMSLQFGQRHFSIRCVKN